MKLSESVTKLFKEIPEKPLKIIETFENADLTVLDKIKIIGIAGSRGKTSTAIIVHQYIKAKGFKSILYCSAGIDSPAGCIDPSEGCETLLCEKLDILRFIMEAYLYQPDFIILEVNEPVIKKGLINYLPFQIRALTNIFNDHNIDQGPSKEYVKSIKTFLKDIPKEEQSISVFGITGNIDNECFHELLKINEMPKYTYGSVYTATRNNLDYTKLNSYIYDCSHSMQGVKIKVMLNGEDIDIESMLLMPYNAFNLICAISIIDALGLFEADLFKSIVHKIKIPGREETFRFNDCIVIIGIYLDPALEFLREYQKRFEIKNLRVITGAPGTGFKGWDEVFLSDYYVSQRPKFRKDAMDYLKDYVKHVYITANDHATEDPETICRELKGYLGKYIKSEIIIDRHEAIRKAIHDLREGDCLFIAGRGNRNVFVEGETAFRILKDSDVVLDVIKELNVELA
ncbi:MAG: Mur ligase family protein [Erysipelotrichales bacterium]|nr:Mur ligase family protein [Erysipelotrichales bacterium]